MPNYAYLHIGMDRAVEQPQAVLYQSHRVRSFQCMNVPSYRAVCCVSHRTYSMSLFYLNYSMQARRPASMLLLLPCTRAWLKR